MCGPTDAPLVAVGEHAIAYAGCQTGPDPAMRRVLEGAPSLHGCAALRTEDHATNLRSRD
jgi:hypothetical protein